MAYTMPWALYLFHFAPLQLPSFNIGVQHAHQSRLSFGYARGEAPPFVYKEFNWGTALLVGPGFKPRKPTNATNSRNT